jgi:N-acetylglutamate synthase-like GNAT family acetyltransferase
MSLEAFEKNGLIFRPAIQNDLPKILAFADIFLRRSWLVRREYANDHIEHSWVVFDQDKLVGWAMISGKRVGRTLYNLIVHPKYRNRQIGATFIERLNPLVIRCKTDQTTGDPTEFYRKMGYEITETKLGKNRKINLMRKSEPKSEHPEDDDSV